MKEELKLRKKIKRQREKEDREIDRQREREEMSISKLHGWTGLRERGQSTLEGQYNQEGHSTLGETLDEDKGPFSLAESRGLQKKNENDHQGSSFSETSKGSFSLAKSDFKETCLFPDSDASHPEKEFGKSPIAKRRKTEAETGEFDKETNKTLSERRQREEETREFYKETNKTSSERRQTEGETREFDKETNITSSERRQTEGETREFDKERSGKVRQTEGETREFDKETSGKVRKTEAERKEFDKDTKVHPFFARNTKSKLDSVDQNSSKVNQV